MTGLEILVLLAVCGAVTSLLVLLALYFGNINIFKIAGDTTKQMPQQYYNEFFTLYDVSPTKICLLRIPETDFQAQVTQIAYFWNGHIAFINNGQIVYTIDDKAAIEPEDPIAFVRGDDTYCIKIVTHGHKLMQNAKMQTLMAQNAIMRSEMADMRTTLKDTLIKYGETMRESRKALNWNPQYGGGWNSPISGYRRPLIGMGGGEEGGEGGGGDF